MDLRLKIEGNKVVTSLYAKPLALHLYLSPHSCHAPGVLSGLSFGNVLRIHQLCSAAADIKKELELFLPRLLNHGYQLKHVTPLLQQAIDNATMYLNISAQMPAIEIKESNCQLLIGCPSSTLPPSKPSIKGHPKAVVQSDR